jgi:hypothetical protein
MVGVSAPLWALIRGRATGKARTSNGRSKGNRSVVRSVGLTTAFGGAVLVSWRPMRPEAEASGYREVAGMASASASASVGARARATWVIGGENPVGLGRCGDLRGPSAAPQDDTLLKKGATAKATAKAKANTGILHFVQNDGDEEKKDGVQEWLILHALWLFWSWVS